MSKPKNKIISIVCAAVTALFLFVESSCFIAISSRAISSRIRGNGTPKTERLSHSNFDAVSIGGDWTVDIRYSEIFSVTIVADENLFSYLDIYVSDKTLHIGFQRGYTIDRARCKAFITMPSLTQLTASGSLTGTISSFNMHRKTLSIDVSGSGDITAQGIIVDTLKLKLSGSGSFTASGEAEHMIAAISGSGDIKTTRLEAETADISISGSGSAKVWVTRLLTADISGSGSIGYKGNPTIIRRISGSGSVYAL